ncbi:hypothetical protein VSR82_14445 [Burkholderia sp. JPY481]
MPHINEAVTALPALIADFKSGATHEAIVLLRDGQPVARLVLMQNQRIGIARGAFDVPDSIPSDDAKVKKLFVADDNSRPPEGDCRNGLSTPATVFSTASLCNLQRPRL